MDGFLIIPHQLVPESLQFFSSVNNPRAPENIPDMYICSRADHFIIVKEYFLLKQLRDSQTVSKEYKWSPHVPILELALKRMSYKVVV